MKKNTICFRDYDMLKSNALKSGSVEEVIKIHESLKGKTCSDEDRIVRDFGVKLVYDLFSEENGRTFVYEYNDGASGFFKSKYLSDYFKESIKILLKDDLLDEDDNNKKIIDILNSDKEINDMNDDDLKLLFSAIKEHYQAEENNEYNVANYFVSYMYKLDGDGPSSYLKNNIPSEQIARHILWATGVSDRASYYSGRGVNYSDLGPSNLIGIFSKLCKVDTDYALSFAKMVCLMKTLGATEFINNFLNFAKNGFSTNGLFFEKSNISLDDVYDDKRDLVAMASIVSTLSKNDDDDYQLIASKRMKKSFLSGIEDYVNEIDPFEMKLLLISAELMNKDDYLFDDDKPFSYHM